MEDYMSKIRAIDISDMFDKMLGGNSTMSYIRHSEEFVGMVLKHTLRKYFDETKKESAHMTELNSLFIGVMEAIISHIKQNHNPEILKEVKKYVVTPEEMEQKIKKEKEQKNDSGRENTNTQGQ
jgi:hypothetical protein